MSFKDLENFYRNQEGQVFAMFAVDRSRYAALCDGAAFESPNFSAPFWTWEWHVGMLPCHIGILLDKFVKHWRKWAFVEGSLIKKFDITNTATFKITNTQWIDHLTISMSDQESNHKWLACWRNSPCAMCDVAHRLQTTSKISTQVSGPLCDGRFAFAKRLEYLDCFIVSMSYRWGHVAI